MLVLYTEAQLQIVNEKYEAWANEHLYYLGIEGLYI